VTNSAKLSISFSLSAVFLLAVGAVAIQFIDHVNSILSDSGFYNLQIDQVADTTSAIRVAPQQRANLTRLDDLEKWTRSDSERTQVDKARRSLERNAPGEALAELEALSTYYRKASQRAHHQLLTIHQEAIQWAIILMSTGVILLVILMIFVRRWFLNPLFNAQVAIQLAITGDSGQSDRKNEMSALVAPIHELTMRVKQSEDRAARAERLAAAGEMAVHVGQNLRQLIRSIRTLAVSQRDAPSVAPGAKAGFQAMVTAAETMDHWTAGLVNATRPLELQACPQSIEPIIRDSVSLLGPSFSERAIKVEFNHADALPNAPVDRRLLEQVMVAVLQNAIDASPDESRITIMIASSPNQMVVVTIADEGEGMSEEVCKHAFDPFFTRKQDGVGLGLPYARKIVELHGGKIDIESEPTKGTRVHVYLPVAGTEKPQPASSAARRR
jgi:signal transduction histidine kinase